MKPRPLFVQLFSSFLVITVVLLAIFIFVAGRTFKNFYETRISDDLKARAELVKDQFKYNLSIKYYSRLQDDAFRLGKEGETRITIIDLNGDILADSHEINTRWKNQKKSPEFMSALVDGHGVDTRKEPPFDEDYLFVAIPVKDAGVDLAILRLSVPITSLNETLWGIYLQLIIGSIFSAVVIAILSWFISRRMSKPLEEIKNTAENIASGNFTANLKFKTTTTLEVQRLGASINEMSEQLEKRIETILAQKNEIDAVFASMTEGVLTVDLNREVRHMNLSARKILGVNKDNIKGISIDSLGVPHEILSYIKEALDKEHIDEKEVKLSDRANVTLRLSGSSLYKSKKAKSGVVIVINDISEIVLAEKQRRDFVTNVSHELRTPLTSIQGFAETLMNPAVKDPIEIKKFVEIIHRHATRLGALIEDILALSRLEKDAESSQIELRMGSLLTCIGNAVDLCREKSKKHGIDILFKNTQEDIQIKMNMHLLEQAIVNLIDNALKYSDTEKRIEVQLEITDDAIKIHVIDFGAGIPEKHLSRLFERFYRVDKARSRTVGGTGLGLAIVKHVATAHNGYVDVESKLGQGSKFTIVLNR